MDGHRREKRGRPDDVQRRPAGPEYDRAEPSLGTRLPDLPMDGSPATRWIPLLLFSLLAPLAGAGPLAYIADGADAGAVTVLDTATDTIVGMPVPVGYRPAKVVVSPNGRRVYVLNEFHSTNGGATQVPASVSVVDATTGNLTSTLQDLGYALDMALTDDGRTLFVLDNIHVHRIDVSSGVRTKHEISGLANLRIAVDPGAKNLYIAANINAKACSLRKIDTATFAITPLGTVFAGTCDMALDKTGTWLYIGGRDPTGPAGAPTSLLTLSAASGAIVGTVVLDPILYIRQVAVTSVGTVLALADRLAVVDGMGQVRWIAVGGDPAGMSLSPDERFVYVTNKSDASVTRIDLSTGSTTTLTGFRGAYSRGTFIGPAAFATAVEFYHGQFDHYFITTDPKEVAGLDAGTPPGWQRTGETFDVSARKTSADWPVCRFYVPPAQGDSHFFSAFPAECAEVRTKFPFLLEETSAAFFAALPDSAGTCAPGDKPVYRLWNRRADSNHRYTTSIATRNAMIDKGYVAEGYGPQAVAMCVR